MPTSPASRRRHGLPRLAPSVTLRVAPLLVARPLLGLVAACGGPDHSGASRAAESPQRTLRPHAPWAVVDGWRRWVYSHSLTLLMGIVFLLSWGAQFVAGTSAYNGQRLQDLQAPLSLGQYFLTRTSGTARCRTGSRSSARSAAWSC